MKLKISSVPYSAEITDIFVDFSVRVSTDCALVEADYKVPDGGAVSPSSTTFTVGTDTSKTVTLITMD